MESVLVCTLSSPAIFQVQFSSPLPPSQNSQIDLSLIIVIFWNQMNKYMKETRWGGVEHRIKRSELGDKVWKIDEKGSRH